MNTVQLLPISLDLVSDSRCWDIHPFLQPEIPVDLAESFSKTGLLHPPVVYQVSNGKYEIIAGRRRLRAAKEILHLKDCSCLVAPCSTPPEEVLSILLEIHRFNSPFSPMEVAYFCKIGLQHLPIEKFTETLLARITGRCNVSTTLKYIQLVSLENELQHLVHNLFINESMAHELLKLTPEDRIRITQLFKRFQMGGGKQKRFLSLLRDACQRSNLSFSTFLERLEVRDILDHREMNNPQKLHSLFSHLQNQLTPTYMADEDAFKLQIINLKIPNYCSVQHSPAFETDEVSLTIRFKNMDLLNQTWPAIGCLLQKSLFRNNNKDDQ